jgi:thiol-disulfide isomerase/thioredoxin
MQFLFRSVILILAVISGGFLALAAWSATDAYLSVSPPAQLQELRTDYMTTIDSLAPQPPTAPAVAATTTTPDISSSPAPEKASTDSPAPSAPAAWHAPAVMPVVADGTLTTPSAIYNNVRIINVEADRVTFLHANGRATVPMWQLPATLQQQLNYDPKAAEALATQRQPDLIPAESAPAMILPPSGPTPVYITETTDYSAALSAAKSSGKLVLLHFTGSDWCPYCKMLDDEVLSKSAFNQFATSNYITVTLDFPHSTSLPDSLKQQNDSLAQKYHIDGYPTLLVIDRNEKELGRIAGYNPGSGPDGVISQLQNFNH